MLAVYFMPCDWLPLKRVKLYICSRMKSAHIMIIVYCKSCNVTHCNSKTSTIKKCRSRRPTQEKMFVWSFFTFYFGNSLHFIAKSFFLEICGHPFFYKSFLDIYFCPFLKSREYFGQLFFRFFCRMGKWCRAVSEPKDISFSFRLCAYE
jgi:hypothetical protein